MKLNKAGLDLIKSFEGLALESYVCSGGRQTVGYGTTLINGKMVQNGLKISLEDAERFLIEDIKKFESGVSKVVSVGLTDNQFSALVTFSYNVGLGALRGSTLLKIVNRNPNDPLIRNEFMKWNKAAGKELTGLTRRRKAESDLYFTK
jgi:lysozyme